MATLSQLIDQLTNPAPVSQDPEDIDDVTTARVPTSSTTTAEVNEGATHTSTKIRRQAAALLVEEDSRYAGKKVSRQLLQDAGTLAQHTADDNSDIGDSLTDSEYSEGSGSEDIEQGIEDNQDDGEDDSEDMDEIHEKELADFKKKIESKGKKNRSEFSLEGEQDHSQYVDDSGDNEGSAEDSSEGGEEEGESADEDESDDSSDNDEGGISQFTKPKGDEDVKKGEATKTQLTLWDQLLKARIDMQKVVQLVNQLPQPVNWGLFKHTGGQPYASALTEGQNAVKSVLDKLFYLQLRLLLQHPETKPLEEEPQDGAARSSKKAADDEEIPSDSDEGEEVAPTRNLKRKQKLQDYPDLLAKRHKAFTQYRNDTIQKWYDKTRVATGKVNRGFSAFEQSALKQIRQILSDRDRLVKRTQMKRTPYRVLGTPDVSLELANQQEKDVEEAGEVVSVMASRDRGKEYDEEVFDDDDFYHQLLRELIECRSLASNDPVALSRQWLELQKLRSKVKRKVDTRASKGRKIRYDILPKLVNFMAPSVTSAWTDEARDDLYSSLFGKCVSQEGSR